MLPFLDKKKIVSVIVNKRGRDIHDVKPEISKDVNPKLESACEDILLAIDDKSVIDLASAIKAAFQALDSEPHVEGEHLQGDK